MTTTTPRPPKVLRVGLIHKGKIIDERLMYTRKPVTCGESARNTFVIPVDNLPSRFPVFEVTKEDAYVLTFPEWMQGKVHQGNQTFTLAAACESKLASPSGYINFSPPTQEVKQHEKTTVYRMPLNDASKGVIRFGAYSLLFQFVAPPPKPKPLPSISTLERSWFQGVDWVYSSILLLSFVAHTGFIYWAKTMGELPAAKSQELIPERFADPLRCRKNCNPFKPEPPKVLHKNPKKKLLRRKPVSPSQARKPKVKGSRKVSAKPAKRPQVVTAAMARRMARHLIIGSDSKEGKHKNLMQYGEDAGSKIIKTLEQKDGIAVPTDEDKPETSRRFKKPGKITLDGDDAPKGDDVPFDQKGKTPQRRKRIVIVEPTPEDINVDGDKTLDISVVMKRLKRNRRQLQYCYEMALKSTPGLKGKVAFNITIALNGRVSAVEVEENQLNGTAVKCMLRTIRRWRFAKPKKDAFTFSVPFLFMSQ